ncbi:MAG: transposase [Candidatus Competibacteraceae bacterium]|nr:transposase [Candidatus Competibacteraceae bacterium]
MSAISNSGLVRFRFIEQAMNVELFIEFLGQLGTEHSQKVLILDNLKVHHAGAVTQWVGEYPKQIELFYRPPYAPERNPTEYLNRGFKTPLRLSTRSSTYKTLRQEAETFLQFPCNPPELVMAYFNHPTAHYSD